MIVEKTKQKKGRISTTRKEDDPKKTKHQENKGNFKSLKCNQTSQHVESLLIQIYVLNKTWPPANQYFVWVLLKKFFPKMQLMWCVCWLTSGHNIKERKDNTEMELDLIYSFLQKTKQRRKRNEKRTRGKRKLVFRKMQNFFNRWTSSNNR